MNVQAPRLLQLPSVRVGIGGPVITKSDLFVIKQTDQAPHARRQQAFRDEQAQDAWPA